MVNGNTCYMSNFAFILVARRVLDIRRSANTACGIEQEARPILGYSALKGMQERNLTYAANL